MLVGLLFIAIMAAVFVGGPLWLVRLWGEMRYGRLSFFMAALHRNVRRNRPMLGTIQALLDEAVLPRSALEPILGRLIGGERLGQALLAVPEFFPPTYAALIDLGERTGGLDVALDHVVRDLQERQHWRARLLSRFAYPLIVLTIYNSILTYMMLTIMPKFRDIFNEFDHPLPPALRAIYAGWNAFGRWLIPLFVFAFIAAALTVALASAGGRRLLPGLRSRIRALSARFPIGRRRELSAFAASMSASLSAGATVPEALDLAVPVLAGPLQQTVTAARAGVADGKPLSDALGAAGRVPRTFLWMIRSGERAGRLPLAFGQLHELYVQRTNRLLDIVASLIPPVAVLLLGAIVGLLAYGLIGGEAGLVTHITDWL